MDDNSQTPPANPPAETPQPAETVPTETPPTEPTPPSDTPPENPENKPQSARTKRMIGIVIGAILVIMIALLIFRLVYAGFNATNNTPTPTPEPSEAPTSTPIASASPSITGVRTSATPSVKPSVTTTQTTGLKLTNVSPSSGTVGQLITINGSSLGTENGDVIFCTSSCTYGAPIESWSATQVKARVPGMIATPGTYEFYIRTKAGQTTNRLTYTIGQGQAQPIINSISPSGQGIGGQLTISGTGFGTGQGQVRFYKDYPTVAGVGAVVSWSDGEVKITIPGTLTNGTEYAIQVSSSGGAESSVKYYTLGN